MQRRRADGYGVTIGANHPQRMLEEQARVVLAQVVVGSAGPVLGEREQCLQTVNTEFRRDLTDREAFPVLVGGRSHIRQEDGFPIPGHFWAAPARCHLVVDPLARYRVP